MTRVFVVGDGEYDIGSRHNQVLGEELPALAEIVRRLMRVDKGVEFICCPLKGIQTRQSGHTGPHYKKKVLCAVRDAVRIHRADAVAVVIDRDRQPEHLREMQAGRDELDQEFLPLALGVAVETFDVWMVADVRAMRQVQGCERAEAHPSPESLDGKPGTNRHPKEYAKAQLGADRLWEKYALVARKVDLDHLEKVCPEGFGCFANEVRYNLSRH